MTALLVLSILGTALAAGSASPRCIYSGKPIDWYIIHQFPQIANSSNPLFSGYRYAIIGDSHTGGWRLSPHLSTDPHGSFATTLVQLENKNVSWIMYNDEPFEGSNGANLAQFAHAKGVLGGDEHGGFWLIHSIPFWPQPGPVSIVYKSP